MPEIFKSLCYISVKEHHFRATKYPPVEDKVPSLETSPREPIVVDLSIQRSPVIRGRLDIYLTLYNQHFLLYPQCFSTLPKQISIFQSSLFCHL